MIGRRRSGGAAVLEMWIRMGAVVCCALGPAAAGAAGATIPAQNARIVEVTVFPDRAEVVREAKVELSAGVSTVEFSVLPWQVEPDSLRASARGVAASLGAVELRERADEPKETPDLVAAREEVRRIEMDLGALAAADRTTQEMREFLTALKATAAARESEEIGEGKADPNSIQAMYLLIRKQHQDLDAEALARRDRSRKLEEDLKVARARLAAARPAGAIRTKSATVEVEAKQAGSLTLRLAYLVPGASWNPSYRASLDAATGAVSLVSEAVVQQKTGEDWGGVTLRLSTAAPARGVKPPEMTSLLLRPVEIVARQAALGGAFGRGVPEAPPAPSMVQMESKAAGAEEDEQAGAFQEVESERREAGVVHSAYNVAFEVPGRSEVPADGRDHRVGLRQEALQGSIAYRAVPALNAAAFMMAKTRAPAGYPLLAGPVRVFASGAYLGVFPLEETGPGSELTLPFGIDNRIAVERTPLPQARGRSGIFGKERRIAYAFRTTIENLRDGKVTVVVEDRVPVSEDERIKVEPGEGTTPGFIEAPDRPGILEWTFALDPREKREVVLEYAVRFPKDLFVPGLE